MRSGAAPRSSPPLDHHITWSSSRTYGCLQREGPLAEKGRDRSEPYAAALYSLLAFRKALRVSLLLNRCGSNAVSGTPDTSVFPL
eukprot:852566-Pleurochrysis_carterae.AAC.1